jgi:hypothetical protein
VEYLPFKDPPVAGFTYPDPGPASRATFPAPGNPVSTGSIAIRAVQNGTEHRALGALGSSCGNRRTFHQATKSLRPKDLRVNTKPSPKSFVKPGKLKAEFHPVFQLFAKGSLVR